MIKSLLEPEENQPEKIKTEPEEKAAGDAAVDEKFESYFAGIESPPESSEEPENSPKISGDELVFSENTKQTMPVETTGETFDISEPQFNQSENSFPETTNYESLDEIADERANERPLVGFPINEINFDLPSETNIEKRDYESASKISNETAISESPAEAKTEKPKIENSGLLFQSSAEPESFAETARKSGLAYAAAITLFGSIVFMLIIGWFADLLLGSSPWGIVGGIILGAAIGFFQFFRLTSQILKDKD